MNCLSSFRVLQHITALQAIFMPHKVTTLNSRMSSKPIFSLKKYNENIRTHCIKLNNFIQCYTILFVVSNKKCVIKYFLVVVQVAVVVVVVAVCVPIEKN